MQPGQTLGPESVAMGDAQGEGPTRDLSGLAGIRGIGLLNSSRHSGDSLAQMHGSLPSAELRHAHGGAVLLGPLLEPGKEFGKGDAEGLLESGSLVPGDMGVQELVLGL